MDVYAWIWLSAVILLAMLEAVTASLVSLWFVGGALAAFAAALLGGPLWLQITLFVVVSAALLACLRPFVRKVLRPRLTPTNADRIVGKQAPVTQTVNNLLGTGAVKLDGKEWTARTVDDTVLEEGSVARVLRIEGVKVIVEKV